MRQYALYVFHCLWLASQTPSNFRFLYNKICCFITVFLTYYDEPWPSVPNSDLDLQAVAKTCTPKLRCHPEVTSDQTMFNAHGVFPDQNYRVWDFV